MTTGYTGPASFPDGSTSLAFTFNDFNVGEHFTWLIDVDAGNTGTTVLGSGLIASTGFANFSNGGRGHGRLRGPRHGRRPAVDHRGRAGPGRA